MLKLTGREKQKLNTQIDHLFKASDKLCEYEKSLDILGDRIDSLETGSTAGLNEIKAKVDANTVAITTERPGNR